MTDADDQFPHALDASDKFASGIWDGHPEWQARIPYMPLINEALQPYIKSKEVFKCPSDDGTYVLDNHFPESFNTRPSMYQKHGSSYLFRTEIAFRQFTSTSFQLPANVNVLFDGGGHWHSTRPASTPDDSYETFFFNLRQYRYNTLYGDFHVKSLTYDQLSEAWATDL